MESQWLDSTMSESSSANTLSQVTVLSKTPDILTSAVNEGLAMMNVESGNYYGLDDIGMKIWDLIDGKLTLGEISARLTSEHEVTVEQCWTDVCFLVRKLLEHELITISQGHSEA